MGRSKYGVETIMRANQDLRRRQGRTDVLARLAGGAAPRAFIAATALLLAACGTQEEGAADATPKDAAATSGDAVAERDIASLNLFDTQTADRFDKFSYGNFDAVRPDHIDLDLTVDFAARQLAGTATLNLVKVDAAAAQLILDTDDLEIDSIEAAGADGTFSPTAYLLGDDDPLLGSKLTIELPADAEKIRIAYKTSPGAAGLQWLEPVQTAGKNAPYVYSQAQAIHARSMAPLQDTPGVRITYNARLKIADSGPDGAYAGLVALMGASQDPDGDLDGDYSFEMPQPIPSYLLALAAGDIKFKAINDTIGVYAEEYILDASAAEFEDTPQMEDVAEALYGPYRWGRYDMIVLPPSFPFGGMENPRLSFLTPTLVAGDKSLTNVVAHELAHSWSGNLVTNATWRDAWLNEGFTSYVENRIMEALYGEERAIMERSLDLANLRRTVADLEDQGLTQLKLPASLEHPDDAFTLVPYVKGMFFLKFLETRFGRDAFDPFLKDYFETFAFKAVVTEDFLAYLNDNLRSAMPDAVSDDELRLWIHGQGLPDSIENPQSNLFAAVNLQQSEWLDGTKAATAIETAEWSTHEWLHFVNTLPDSLTPEQLAELDAAFGFSTSQNAETAFAWYMKAIKAGYEPAFPPLRDFLIRVGRGKFIYRLYGALAEGDRRDWAADVYQEARPGYHPIAQRRIDAIFEESF